jgi:hypothetical protein
MMSDAPLLPITTYWTTANREFFVDRVKACHINIDDTTPAAIYEIRNKYWAHKSILSFRSQTFWSREALTEEEVCA